LGHIIDHTFCDDNDIKLKCLFANANVLVRRFSYCSMQLQFVLFILWYCTFRKLSCFCYR